MLQDGVWESSRVCNALCQDSRHRLLLLECYEVCSLHLTTYEDSLLHARLKSHLFSGTNDLMKLFAVIRLFTCRWAGGNLAMHLLMWLGVSG